ncbi:MAG: EAL domain-containing protein [Colwellia sp.]|jgi:diguanylate cyclase (GGDEF)-like protein
MESKAKEDILALRQLPKLRSLLKKYRQVKVMQSGLLQLSELASTVTDMAAFYAELKSVIKTLLTTDSFHITLLNTDQNLELAHCHNPEEIRLLDHLKVADWRKCLTGIVFKNEKSMHCSAKERIALAKSGDIFLYGSSCVDWLGVPLRRGNQVIGVLALQSYDDKLYFDAHDCQLLEFIALHLVTAIDRVRSRELLEESILQRTQKLTEANKQLQLEITERKKVVKMHKALLSISEITANSQDIDCFYRAIHQEINTLLPAKNLYIALLDDNDDKEHSIVTFPYYDDERVSSPLPRMLGFGLTELAIKAVSPTLISEGEVFYLSEQGKIRSEPLTLDYPKNKMPQAWLAAPLMVDGKIFGILAIQHYQDSQAYQQSDLKLIRFISQHVDTAILRKRSQAEIKMNNEALEKTVNQRTQELQASNLNLRMQIDERRKAEAQLYYEAHHDGLTKLPNRAMFSDRLSYSLRHLKRHPDQRFAVLFIDLDRFKMINDTLGHHAGDKFLIEIALRLQDCVRDNDILARLGGDEFVILLDSLQLQEDIEEVASRIITAIAKPFSLGGHTLYSNASIGIAQCSSHYKDSHEILRDADAAMYQAKNLGRGRYVFFDESMREQLIASMTLEQELRVAITKGQFELHYQQISNLSLTNTIGFEALLRWQHPTKGILTPSEFLYMAEETGMILDIDAWVIKEVSEQLKSWQQSKDYYNAFIGINLSGRHLTQANQLNKLINQIKDTNIEPHRLILEFNESAFAQQSELALKNLRRLKDFGVKLALDDYGAGSSSLNFLHNYPFEFIKLDRSFVRTLNTNDKNLSLVKALHDLGSNFGYHLVAEGIESEEMLKKLQNVGCEFGQGYHISRPIKMPRIINESEVIVKASA